LGKRPIKSQKEEKEGKEERKPPAEAISK